MKKLMIGTLCIAAAVQFAIAEEADAGVQTVAKVQATPPPQVEAKTAKEKIEQALEKTFGKTWRVKSSTRKITVADVSCNMDNPVTEKELFTIRELLCKRALLQAKVQLAESMSVEADADFGGSEGPEVNAGEKVTKTFVSGMTLAAKEPQTVFGATILNQAESFENGAYHLAVAVVWSEGLKNAAASFLAADKPMKFSDPSKDEEYVADWLAKQKWGTMCGPRQIMGPSGERHFLGISAREIGTNAEGNATNIRLAQLSAIQSLLFSLYADVSFQDVAKAGMKLVTAGGANGITQGEVIETLERQMSLKAKKVLRGLDEIYGEEVVHPITGRKMYVSVYEMSASKAARAKQFSADIAALRAKVAQADTADRAYNQGLQDAINAAANDQSAAHKASAEAHNAVESQLNPGAMLPAAEGSSPAGADTPKPNQPKPPKPGVFGGDETINTNIL